MSDTLYCWRCGSELQGVILPLSRREECSQCAADQHVCKLCKHYKEGVADSCTEDRAEAVTDKERANFCDYFAPSANAYRGGADDNSAQRELAALFGDEPAGDGENTEPPPSAPTSNEALTELDKLFGKDDEQ